MTAGRVEFEVVGDPAAQGSKRHVGNGIMVEQSKKLAPWRSTVAAAARDHAPAEPMTGPLSLMVAFRFPMPASRSKKIREAGRNPKTSAPDLDKLVRAVGDALKAGGLIHDDALFVAIAASKFEVVGWTGATIAVAPWAPAVSGEGTAAPAESARGEAV